MIPYTPLCRYLPLRFSRAAKTPDEADFQISGIKAALEVSTCKSINSVISWIHRKKNDGKRCIISRELPFNRITIFDLSRNCSVYVCHYLEIVPEILWSHTSVFPVQTSFAARLLTNLRNQKDA